MFSKASGSFLLQAVWGVGELMAISLISPMVKKILHGLLGGRFTKSGQRLVKRLCWKMLIRHLGGQLEASSRKSRGAGNGIERGKRSSSVRRRRGGKRGKTFKENEWEKEEKPAF